MTQELVPADATEIIPAAHVERLAALDMAATEYVKEQRPKNTSRAYRDDWATWLDYTAAVGIPETSASNGALVGFVAWLERHKQAAPSTIERRLGGVVSGLRDRGVEPAKKARQDARDAIKNYARRLAEAGETRGRGQAPAMTVDDLRAMCKKCLTMADTLAGARDRALLLIAFGIAGRRSEVASLLVSDVVEQHEGLMVTVRYGKSGARTVAVPYGSNPDTCPVRAWRAWLAASGISDGPAFRRIDRHGRMLSGLSGQAVGDVITRAADRAGVMARLTGHSVRAGLATEARRAGRDRHAIEKQGGWIAGSRALGAYLRIVDAWTDNALVGVGL